MSDVLVPGSNPPTVDPVPAGPVPSAVAPPEVLVDAEGAPAAL